MVGGGKRRSRAARGWRSLVEAMEDPTRSEFAFVPHHYVYAPAELVDEPLSPSEVTPINNDRSEFGRHNHTHTSSQLNRFFVMHLLAIGTATISSAWLLLFPLSPNRLYDMQVDVFNTNHYHATFFSKPCVFLGNIFGAAAAGFLGDWLGRASVLELSAIPFVLGWLLIAFAYGEITVLIGRYLLGTAAGLVSVVAPIYLAEVSAAQTRGRVLCVRALFAGCGRLLYLAIGVLFVHMSHAYIGFNLSAWKVLAMVGLVPGLLLLLLMQKLSDSPTWLINRHDDRDTAFDILYKLFSRGYRSAEYQVNCIIHAKMLAAYDRAHHGAFFRPLLLCCALFTLRAIAAFLIEPTLSPATSNSFTMTVFGIAIDAADVDLLYAMAFMWVAACFGMVACFILIDVRGRVVAMQAGCYIASFCSLFLILYSSRTKPMSFQLNDCGSAVMLLIMAGHQLGLGVGPVVLVSELFPVKQRMGAVSVVFIWEGLVNVTLSYLVPLFAKTLSSFQVFGLCAVIVLTCNAAGLVIVWLYLPETSQRSLQEIEAILSGWRPATPTVGSSRVRLEYSDYRYGT